MKSYSNYRFLLSATTILSVLFWLGFSPTSTIFKTENGRISFTSEAPLELIQAESESLRGVLDLEKKQFAFSVNMKSFSGFNSPLQQEHFNENYLETNAFPKAIFTGRIIDNIDMSSPGTYQVRTKGKLTVHGISQERIIKGSLVISEQKITISSNFSVLLKEHNISIPKIVYQKIAEQINISLTAELLPVP